MANYDKFTRSDMGLLPTVKKKDENGNYVTFGNQRIDPRGYTSKPCIKGKMAH